MNVKSTKLHPLKVTVYVDTYVFLIKIHIDDL